MRNSPCVMLSTADLVPSLSVEAAEEKLVNATEEAINLMRSVLDNPEPIKNLQALVKAQQAFYAEAAEVRSTASACRPVCRVLTDLCNDCRHSRLFRESWRRRPFKPRATSGAYLLADTLSFGRSASFFFSFTGSPARSRHLYRIAE